MRVGQRLVLGVVPAIIGLFIAAGLAYWGRPAYKAPESVVVVALVASLVSLIVAWRNTRYVAQRVERLAGMVDAEQAAEAERIREEVTDPRSTSGSPHTATSPDELDAIEQRVHGLSRAVRDARDDGARRERAAEARATESESLLDEALRTFGARLEEVQLPLHILLSSPFGELNENQEEMLGAARTAADAADIHLRKLAKLLALERGEVTIVAQPTTLADLLRPPLAIAEARAAKALVPFRATIDESAPRVMVDPMHADEALTALFVDAVRRTPPGSEVTVNASATDDNRIDIAISHGSAAPPDTLDYRLATRLVDALSGAVREVHGRTIIQLPAESLRKVAR